MKQLIITSVVLFATWRGVTQATSNLPITTGWTFGGSNGAGNWNVDSFPTIFGNGSATNGSQVPLASDVGHPRAGGSISQSVRGSVDNSPVPSFSPARSWSLR
jgi:hypothetical protein